MLTTREIPSRKRVFKLVSRIVCLLVLIPAAYSLSTAQSGPRISCLLDLGDGAALLVSCGSSAGNFIGICEGGGCEAFSDNPADNWLADQVCADYQANGCPTQ